MTGRIINWMMKIGGVRSIGIVFIDFIFIINYNHIFTVTTYSKQRFMLRSLHLNSKLNIK